jgi:hypothetical protein
MFESRTSRLSPHGPGSSWRQRKKTALSIGNSPSASHNSRLCASKTTDFYSTDLTADHPPRQPSRAGLAMQALVRQSPLPGLRAASRHLEAPSGPFSVERAPLNLNPHTRVDDPALYCAGGISILLSAKWTSCSHAALTRTFLLLRRGRLPNDDVFSAIGALNEPIIAWLDHYVASIDLPRLFSSTQNGLLCAQFRA